MFLRAFLTLLLALIALPQPISAESIEASVYAGPGVNSAILTPTRSVCRDDVSHPAVPFHVKIGEESGLSVTLETAAPQQIRLENRGRAFLAYSPPILYESTLAPIRFPELEKINVTVLDETGALLQGIQIHTSGFRSANGHRLLGAQAKTLSDGDVQLWIAENGMEELLVPGFEILEIETPSRKNRRLRIRPAMRPIGEPTVEKYHWQGWIVDDDGNPLEGAYVWDPKEPECWTVADATGLVRLDSMRADHQLLAGAPGLEIISLRSAEEGKRFTLKPADGALAFELKDHEGRPIRDARIEILGTGRVGYSDSSGRLELFGMPAYRSAALEVSHSSFVKIKKRWMSMPAHDAAETKATWTLDRPSEVRGSVVDEQGHPLADTRVDLVGRASRATVTPKDGRFKFTDLGSGTHALRLESAEGDVLFELFATFPAGGPVKLEPVVMKTAQELWGRVTGSQGEPLGDVAVHLHRPEDGESSIDVFGRLRAPVVARTGPDGFFRISGLPHSSARLGFTKNGFASKVAILKTTSSLHHEIQLEQLSALEIQVFSQSDHKPIPGANLMWSYEQYPGGSGSRERTGESLTDAEGRATLFLTPRGSPRMSVDHPDFVGLELKVSQKSLESGELTLELTPAARLEGRVVDQRGRPLENVRAYAQLPKDQPTSLGTITRTDRQGRFALSGLETSSTVEVTFRDPRIGTQTRAVELSGDLTEVEVVLPLHEISQLAGFAQWHDGLPVKSAILELVGSNGSTWPLPTDETGAFRHDALPRDHYQIYLRSNELLAPVAGRSIHLDEDVHRWLVVFHREG